MVSDFAEYVGTVKLSYKLVPFSILVRNFYVVVTFIETGSQPLLFFLSSLLKAIQPGSLPA